MSGRRAVVGLGNPGPRYEGTRHNAGFVVVESFLRGFDSGAREEASNGALWTVLRSEELGEVVVVKPQTYMNRSGGPVAELLAMWEVSPSDMLVVHDDLDLTPGRIKLKRGGGCGGHRGLLSIEEEAGTRDFCRLRLGVGHPGPQGDVAEYVLSPFSDPEKAVMVGGYGRARDGVEAWLRLDLQAAMKIVNTHAAGDVEPAVPGC